MSRFLAPIALALTITFGFGSPAGATLVLGTFLGPGTDTNDSVEQILADFGLEVILLARIEPPEGGLPISGTVVDGLSYDNFTLNDDAEPSGGQWSYAGPGTVDIIAVKAGPNWGLWLFTPENTSNMPNMGLFDTLQLQPGNPPGDQRGFGDVTAYSLVVPEPSALALVGVGLLALGLRRRGALG